MLLQVRTNLVSFSAYFSYSELVYEFDRLVNAFYPVLVAPTDLQSSHTLSDKEAVFTT